MTTSEDPSSPALDQGIEKSLRQHRAELRESMGALEQALASPTPGGRARWVQRVHVALVELFADLGEHIDITEGPDGLYGELLQAAPRLSDPVARLTHEHTVIKDLLETLLTHAAAPEVDDEVERVRDLGTALLGRLVRHRQRGADLVWEAYEVDIGGEA